MGSNLPEELWKLILTHVPLRERLGTCSRVSQKLYRAAAAANEQLEVQLQGSAQRSQAVVQWLQHNGQHVTSLELHGVAAELTELPCQQLRQLVVWCGRVQLGRCSSHPGVLHSCNGLTSLMLFFCEVVDGPKGLSALSAVPALQVLSVSAACSRSDRPLHMPGTILQMLTQLKRLDLSGHINVTAESLQHISALQHLQVLNLTRPSVHLSPSSTPALARVTGLHSLVLSGSRNVADAATLDPALLQHYTLSCLKLEYVTLSGARRGRDVTGHTGASSGASLLSVLGQQLQLEQMQLSGVQCEWPTTAAAYTALTASSRRQKLDLRLDGVPAGIWQAVFQPQQQLPHLRDLVLGSWDAEDGNGLVQNPTVTALSSTDVSRLVGCCPAVEYLNIQLQPNVQLAVLSQLTALRTLYISTSTESSVKSLAGPPALVGLRELWVNISPACSPKALLALTALTQLTDLHVKHVEDVDGDDFSLTFDDNDDGSVYLVD